jgi:hypothetical protein
MSLASTAQSGWAARLLSRGADFLAAPASARPLAVLRIALAVVLLGQAAALARDLNDLCGPLGLMQWPINEAMIAGTVPRVRWLADVLGPWGVSPEGALLGTAVAYLVSLVALLLGWRTRLAAVAAWLTHLLLVKTGVSVAYGVDSLANITLFYFLWMPVGRALSLDAWLRRCVDRPGGAARLSLRALQIHLCVVYLSSGLAKATSSQWWNGEAIWRATMRQDFAQFDFSWLASVPLLAVLACWGTLALEVGYAFCVWSRRARRWTVLATVALHAGIAVALGLWSFSGVMIALNVAAFLVSTEPRAESPCGQEGKKVAGCVRFGLEGQNYG